ncbi:MAG TPA: PH domain-containing protein [Chthoniobacteraceae bacterium]|jgi:uncharacterized membrane protein YdbT with pleckstrin-like domain
MPEETVWTGTSSQLKNLGPFVLCLLVIPIPWAVWRWLDVKSRVFRLTSERLLIESGVFNKTTETLELYRVRDLQVTQPFLLRLFGLQKLTLLTSDTSTPQIVVDYVPTELGLADKFREQVEACRQKKRVREVDIADA